jgi:hypothetical protein
MMPTINIVEGQTALALPGDILRYPSINSCLSITTVDAAGNRWGGHSILVPDPPQQDLFTIYNYIAANPGTNLYIIGDIGTWNENWSDLDQTDTLRQAGINNVQDMAAMLSSTARFGYPQMVLWDTNRWGTNTYDIYFDMAPARNLYGMDAQGTRYQILNHPTW